MSGVDKEVEHGKVYDVIWAVCAVTLCVSTYAYLRVSTNGAVIALVAMTLLQAWWIISRHETFSSAGLGFEISFLVLLLLGIGSHAWSPSTHPGYWSVLLIWLFCSKVKNVARGMSRAIPKR